MKAYWDKEWLETIGDKLEKEIKEKQRQWELEKDNYVEVSTIAAGRAYIHKNLLRKHGLM